MNEAIYKGKVIHLQTIAREKYQLIYEQSLRKKLTCPACGEPVLFYLGIEKKPHFYHEHKPMCIPQSVDQGNVISFVSPSPLSLKEKRKNEKLSGYLQQLKEANIDLDASQIKAVRKINGPLLVLAGAGSGKTRVLTARTAYMICEKQIDPKSIMLVTFTTKAAKEMSNRLCTYPGIAHSGIPVIGTFHSLFYRMLQHFDPIRWHHHRLIKWDWQKEQLLKEIGREVGIDERDFAYDEAIQQISYWKNTLTPVHSLSPKNEWEEHVIYLYTKYEEIKRMRGQFDFDDMLIGCYEMLHENHDLLMRYQERFRYFLIDEFQDINKVQYEIVKLLSSHTNHICVVGDDDQAIYAFRGSDPSFIFQFQQDFPNVETVTLTENYRSTHQIVSLANKIISFNRTRMPKQMHAQFDLNLHPTFFFPYDEEEEATMIAHDIQERIKAGAEPHEFAVLCRTHAATRALFERFSQLRLPFVVDSDGESFYKRRIVRYLLGYLKLSLDPNDEEAMNDVLAALFLKQTALNDLKAISIIDDCSLVEALLKLEDIQPFQKQKLRNIVPLFQTLAHLKPFEAIETIEKDMGFSDFVKKRGNEGNAIERGSDDIRDVKVVAKKFKTVRAFLSHIEKMIAQHEQMKREKQENAIQLTTIHRAKGLEYNYVYVLSAVDGHLPHDYALDAYRNGETAPLEEERRLLYVALTRAKYGLFISVPTMRRLKKANASRFVSPFLKISNPKARL
ncbi:UvrD-helicase domain-containing protein [Thermolongibacillus altinsuensis]